MQFTCICRGAFGCRLRAGACACADGFAGASFGAGDRRRLVFGLPGVGEPAGAGAVQVHVHVQVQVRVCAEAFDVVVTGLCAYRLGLGVLARALARDLLFFFPLICRR